MSTGTRGLDLERVYDALDWAFTAVAEGKVEAEEQEDLLSELQAVRTDLMEALEMLHEHP